MSRLVSYDPILDKEELIISTKYTVKYLKRNFLWFSVVSSLNHALNYVVNSYATTLLPGDLGGICLGLNWILNAVSGLTIATPVVRLCGTILRFTLYLII